MIENLSKEALLRITDALHSPRDVNNFARTCRSIHETVNPILYQRHATDALVWAAEQGKLSTAKKALTAGADVNATDALALAVEGGHEDIVKLLLADARVDPELLDNRPRTPPPYV